MKIDDVTVTIFTWDDIPPITYGSAYTGPRSSDLGLVSVLTDGGVTGYGLLGLSLHPASIEAEGLVKVLKPLILGKDPLDRQALYAAMYSRRLLIRPSIVCALDVALWDIAGKVANLPVHRLLGTFRHAIPVYASSEMHSSAQGYVDQALDIKAQGLHGFKIMHPEGGWRMDVATCTAVRAAVGDDFTLMFDGRFGYDLGDAVRVGRAIEELGFLWFEDPLPEDDLGTYPKLLAKLDIPVMATESPGGYVTDYAPWILLRATDMLRGDVLAKGGITNLWKVAHLAEAFHMKIEFHHASNSINDLANLHLQMAVPNTSFMEVLLPREAWDYGLTQPVPIDENGYAHAPASPGIGADIDFDLIRSKQIAVLG